MQKRPIGDVRDRRRERNNRMYVLSPVRTNRVSLYMFAAEMQHYPTVLQRKTSIQCLEHTVSRTDWACGEPENLFFWPKLFFFT